MSYYKISYIISSSKLPVRKKCQEPSNHSQPRILDSYSVSLVNLLKGKVVKLQNLGKRICVF